MLTPQENILLLIRKNKDDAFAQILRAYATKVYSLSLHHTGNTHDAEDLTQDIFTAVYLALENYKGDAQLYTWIHSIAINKVNERHRKLYAQKRSGKELSFDISPTEYLLHFDHPGIQLEDRELAQLFFAALHQLPDQQREAFVLVKIEGHSYQECSEIMQTSVSSIESLLFRARGRLKQLLEEYYNEHYN